MYLQSIHHAVPRPAYTQADCWRILQNSATLDSLKARSQNLLSKVLKGDSGIGQRHFAAENVAELFTLDGEGLNRRFEREAPRLATEALRPALDEAGVAAQDLDALFICTCTGYLCPGLSSYVAEQLDLGPQTYLQDIVGLGCGAAIPTLRGAEGFIAAHPDATVACIAVEICSAAFYLDDDPGVLISASLFGDAASASIWSNRRADAQYRMHNFDTIHLPEQRELLRFTNRGGKLRNQLHRSIPEVAARAVSQLHSQAKLDEPHTIAAHVGGRDVLDALESALRCPRLEASWQTLYDYGNNSSPSVLIVAERLLKAHPESDRIWLTSFGAGFAAHSCELRRD